MCALVRNDSKLNDIAHGVRLFARNILFIVMNFIENSLYFLLHFVRYPFIMDTNHMY